MISSSTGQKTFIWIRDRSFSWSMLKLTPARDSVARYSFTGMVTRPNWMAPFHMERGTDKTSAGSSLLARERKPTLPPGHNQPAQARSPESYGQATAGAWRFRALPPDRVGALRDPRLAGRALLGDDAGAFGLALELRRELLDRTDAPPPIRLGRPERAHRIDVDEHREGL